jgi:class 3 adenylate cyclase
VKVNTRLASLFINALSQAMPVELMQKVARTVIPDYDVYERSGFPASISLPRADAARHILKDFLAEGLFMKLVEALIEVASRGYMGRDVRIPLLPRIIAEVEDQGYSYSTEKGMFIEAAERGRTMGWGTLREGRTYEFALLRIDVAGNSDLVRRFGRAKVAEAFAALRDMVARFVERRDGRVWGWEGDGGLAAFYFIDRTIQATLCGMEIIHELFFYNLLARTLPVELQVRLCVHAGPCRFFPTPREAAGDTIRRVELLESRYTRPGCLTVSPGVYTDLGSKLAPLFLAVPGPDNSSVFRYSLEWEKP